MTDRKIGVQLSVTGAGQAKTELEGVGKAAAGIGDAATRGAENTAKATQSTSKALGDLSSDLKYVSAGLGALGGLSVKMASDFDLSFGRMVGLAGVTRGEVDGLKKSVLGLAGQTAQAPQALAEGLYFASSAGFRTGEAMDIVKVAAKGAAAGLGDTKVTVDVITSALKAYAGTGLTAAEAGDILAESAKAAKIEASELAPQMGRLLPAASELGVSFTDVAAAMSALSQTSGDASLSATQLEGILVHLMAPTKQGAEELSRLGVSVDDIRQAIQQRGLLGALQMLQEKTGGSAEQLRKIFEDAQAVNGVLSLTGKNAQGVSDIFDQVANHTGSLDSAFKAVAETDAFKIQQALTDVKVAGEQLGATLLPIAASVASGVGHMAEVFAGLPGPVQAGWTALGGIAVVLPVIGGAVSKIGELRGQLDKLSETSPRLASGLKAGAAGLGLFAEALVAVTIASELADTSLSSVTDENRWGDGTKAIRDFADGLTSHTKDLTAFTEGVTKSTLQGANLIPVLLDMGSGVGAFNSAVVGTQQTFGTYLGSINEAAAAGRITAEQAKTLGTALGDQRMKFAASTVEAVNLAVASGKVTRAQVEAAIAARGGQVAVMGLSDAWRSGHLTVQDVNAATFNWTQILADVLPATDAATVATKALADAEEVSKKQAQAAQKDFDALTTSLDKLTKGFDDLFAAQDVQVFWDAIIDKADAAAKAIAKNGGSLEGTSQKARDARAAYDEYLNSVAKAAKASLDAGESVSTIGLRLMDLASQIDNTKFSQKIKDELSGAFGPVSNEVKAFADQWNGTIDAMVAKAKTAGNPEDWVTITQTILRGIQLGVTKITPDIQAALELALKNGAVSSADLQAMGKAIMDGIAAGVIGYWSPLAQALQGSVDQAIIKTKNGLGITSPSRVMARVIGLPLAQGVALGFEWGTADVTAAIGNSIGAAADANVQQATDSGKRVGTAYATGVSDGLRAAPAPDNPFAGVEWATPGRPGAPARPTPGQRAAGNAAASERIGTLFSNMRADNMAAARAQALQGKEGGKGGLTQEEIDRADQAAQKAGDEVDKLQQRFNAAAKVVGAATLEMLFAHNQDIAKVVEEAEAAAKWKTAYVGAIGAIVASVGPGTAKMVADLGATGERIQALAGDASSFGSAFESSFRSATDIVSQFGSDAKVTADDVVGYLQQQVAAAKTWSENLKALADAGIDKGLLQSVAEAGPKAAPLVAALLDAVRRGDKDAINQAQKDLRDLMKQTEDVVGEHLIDYWNAGHDVGDKITGGIAQGLFDGSPGALSAMDTFVQKLIDEANAKLDAHSPSREFIAIALKMMDGWVAGIRRGAPVVMDAQGRMIDAMRQQAANAGPILLPYVLGAGQSLGGPGGGSDIPYSPGSNPNTYSSGVPATPGFIPGEGISIPDAWKAFAAMLPGGMGYSVATTPGLYAEPTSMQEAKDQDQHRKWQAIYDKARKMGATDAQAREQADMIAGPDPTQTKTSSKPYQWTTDVGTADPLTNPDSFFSQQAKLTVWWVNPDGTAELITQEEADRRKAEQAKKAQQAQDQWNKDHGATPTTASGSLFAKPPVATGAGNGSGWSSGSPADPTGSGWLPQQRPPLTAGSGPGSAYRGEGDGGRGGAGTIVHQTNTFNLNPREMTVQDLQRMLAKLEVTSRARRR